ncbi:methylated-DNA--[protein]-cysteine S-methyltransferase [Gordonia sp. (in: high G+C Gram-positive bacteria)]|uniref:methylated-DNA--[protein]-cysteine S-methyltransferase n=1 Tax=Gordonia sp. (in: high G+C Gram-positive bacteria) TaxID=84139 RepID=UPI0026336F18|nr:methylated-DNA--[protein]-cysteine S-methyltransferase [Gordonia sp. (in: high G+C Gram-positive bacteria)]
MTETIDAAPVPESLGWATVKTPDGPFTALFDADGTVYASGWTADHDYLADLIHPALRPAKLVKRPGGAVIEAVRAYYRGDLAAPAAIAVRQRSGPFLQVAWAALRDVPAGPPVTYSELAERSGNSGAIRAAASCCARNAAALFVPCHRVVRRDGTLGGFRYGLEIKESLIARESVAA